MTRELAVVVVLAFLAIALVAAWRGWRTRESRYADLPVLGDHPLSGRIREEFSLLYVATTEFNAPLERIAVAPLAFRGKARLVVRDDGAEIQITGEDPAYIPSVLVDGVGVATWTIDKSVEQDGLIFLRWRWGSRVVDSYFRVVDHPRDSVIRALTTLTTRKTESGVS